MAKIVILSFYSGVVERGVETFAYEAGRRLAKKHEVTILSAGKTTPFQKFRSRQIKAFASGPKASLNIFNKFYLDWPSTKILIFTLKSLPFIFRNKFKIIFPLNGGWQVILIRLVSKIIGAKVIIPGAAGIGSDDAANLLFRPDVFVALTSAQGAWAKRLAPEVKIVTIPNGVDLSRFNPKVKPAQVTLKKPIVICASALVSYKQVDLTIRAVAKTKDLSLLILGDGQLAGYLDGLGKRLLGQRYLRLVVPYKQIPSYYRVGKIFTLASKTEAFGIAYIEAMACNLPVVTTCDDSRAEIIGDAGILTDPANIEKYTKDLEIAAKTNYRNRPYTQSLKFSWNKIIEKYLGLIDEVLKR